LLNYDEKTLRDDSGNRIFRSNKAKDLNPEFALSLGLKPQKPGEGLKKCETLLNMLVRHESAAPFLDPVDPVALNIPDYPEIVKEPMDLGTVRQKLADREYSTPSDMIADIRKIWENSLLYNPSHSPYHKMTTVMKDYFNKQWPIIIENPSELLPAPTVRPKDKVRELSDGAAELKTSFSVKNQFDKPLSQEEKRNLADLVRSRVF
jgi:hypothetical protein